MITCTCKGQDLEWWNKVCEKCREVDSTTDGFCLKGYTYSEYLNTIVKEFHNGKLVDSFLVHPSELYSVPSMYDRSSLKFSGDFGDRYLKTKDTYQFCIPGFPPRVVSNIKTGTRQCGRYGYLCEVEYYDVDGITKKGWELEIIKDTALANKKKY